MFEDFYPADTLAAHRTTGESVTLIDLSRWYVLHVPDADDVETLAQQLTTLPGVEAASPSFTGTTQDVFPDDPLFENGSQWGLHNTIQTGHDIHAPAAWGMNRGRTDVVIAVIDTGVDYNHDDLDPGNRSRVIAGYDVADNDSDPIDDLPSGVDGAGHGTKVAGALGARTDNDLQAAGVMWNLKIMPVKVFYSTGPWWDPFGWTLGHAMDWNLAEGIEWARTHGADVINMSLGGGGDLPWYVDAVWTNPATEASLNAYLQGIVQVAGSGNDDEEKLLYPAIYPWTVAVGASNRDDQRVTLQNTGGWFGSNYGDHLDVVAPGILHGSLDRNNGTTSFSGTSCASPLVAGVAGLVLSESRDLGLNLTNDDIHQILRRSADDVNASTHPGFDEFIGYGRVNAEAALALINAPNTVTHLTRSGGSSTMTWGSHTHTFLNGAYGAGLSLASGRYYGVRRYRVSGHVSFSGSYQQVPEVWVRERETTGWSGANPNNQSPDVHITNITASGFDWETFVYWIGSSELGQQINQYYPAAPSQLLLAFSVLGEPEPLPPLTASISGPSYRNTGQSGTWTATASNGSGSYDYTWEYRINFDFCGGGDPPGPPGPEAEQCGEWTHAYYYDGSPTFSKTVNSDAGMDIRVTVTSGSESVTAYKSVTIGSGPGGGIQPLTGGGQSATTASAEAEATALPERYALHATAPNPVSSTAIIRYDLPQASEVSLVVYDLLGREVERPASGSHEAGMHSVLLDSATLPSGVYVVRLQAGSFVATERFTVVK